VHQLSHVKGDESLTLIILLEEINLIIKYFCTFGTTKLGNKKKNAQYLSQS